MIYCPLCFVPRVIKHISLGSTLIISLGCTHYISSNCVQAVKDRLESEVARQASEVEQLKKDWDKSEKEHKKAIKSIIVSEEKLCDISYSNAIVHHATTSVLCWIPI